MVERLFYPVLPSEMPTHDKSAVSQQPTLTLLTNGMASYPADFLRDPATAKLLLNLLQSRKQGIWTNRDNGMSRYTQTVFNSGAQFYDFGLFIDSTGVEQLVFQCGNQMIFYNMGTNASSNLGAMPTTALDSLYAPFPCIREFQPFVASGAPVSIVTHPGSIQASTISNVPALATFYASGGAASIWCTTAAPLQVKNYSNPALCESFLNRIAYGGFPVGAGNTAGNQNDIILTNAGTYNTVTQNATPVATDADIIQIPPILGRPTALRSIQLNNQNNQQALIIGCTRGVALISGTDSTNFAVSILTRQYGIPSNRAFAQIDNDMMFLSTDGIRCFSSLIINANLLTDAISYGLQDYVQTWDQKFLNRAFAVTNGQTKDVQFWIPQLASNGASSNGVCNLGMNFNYGDSSFGVNSIPNLNFAPSIRQGLSIPCGIELRDPNNNNQPTMLSGGYNGVLYKHYSGNLTDSPGNGGTPLPFIAIFPLVSATANVAQGATVRKIHIITEGGLQNFEAGSTFLTMYANGTMLPTIDPTSPRQLGSTGPTTTILAQWTLGQSAFPGTSVQLLEYEPSGEGRFANMVIQGSQANEFVDLVGAHYLLSAGGLRQ